jgi:S1-C subfamily serine protease
MPGAALRSGLTAALAVGLLLSAWPMASGETLGEAYRRISPSVVVIRARGREVTAAGIARFSEIGSGVLISPDGKIATAAHVVHLMEDVTVEFLGEEPVPARVIASEPRADLSLIQVSVVPRDARVAPLTDSDRVHVGDSVIIIGAPYGLRYSLSSGIISARWEPDTVTRDFPLAEFFQTTAVINTGNSGGPMFTQAGDLIGIVSHNITKSGGSEGLGFVVTSNTVRKYLLERNRRWYGLDLQLLTGPAAEAFKVPQAGGFLVKQVSKDSIGGRLGLRGGDRLGIVDGQQMVVGGDVIVSIQGIPVATNADMVKALQTLETLRAGESMRVTVLRGDRLVELTTRWTP